MMNLIKKKVMYICLFACTNVASACLYSSTVCLIRHSGHQMPCLYVLVALLISEASSQAADSPEEELSSLKLELHSVMHCYRLLCELYFNLATNCSAAGTVYSSSRLQQMEDNSSSARTRYSAIPHVFCIFL